MADYDYGMVSIYCILFSTTVCMTAKKGIKHFLFQEMSSTLHYLTLLHWIRGVNNPEDRYSPAKQMDALTVHKG